MFMSREQFAFLLLLKKGLVVIIMRLITDGLIDPSTRSLLQRMDTWHGCRLRESIYQILGPVENTSP